MIKRFNPVFVKEIGYLYNSDENGSDNLSEKINFACWDPNLESIWISKPELNQIINISVNENRISRKFDVKADWICPTLNHTLLIVNSDGNEITEIDNNGVTLHRWTCNRPVSVYGCRDGNCIIVAESNPNGICVIDRNNNRRWECIPEKGTMGTPGNVIPWRDGFLYSDRYKHVVSYITYDKKASILYGKFKQPDNVYGTLCAPHCVWASENGNSLFICDTLNGKVIEIDPKSKRIIWEYGDADFYGSENNMLWHPNVIQNIGSDKVLICDSMNHIVRIIDKNHGVVFEYGKPRIRRCEFKLPRSVQILDKSILVSDTHHHRVIEVDMDGQIKWEFGNAYRNAGEKTLFFPRCAYKNKKGTIIADAGNFRLIKLDYDNKVEKIYEYLNYKGNRMRIVDPHYVFPVNESMHLLVDSGQDTVLMFNDDGDVMWKYDDLKDPHCAKITRSNDILVADTGNDRIVQLNNDGKFVNRFEIIDGMRLQAPRFIDEYCECNMIIDLNRDDRRIILADKKNHVVNQFTNLSGIEPGLNHSRWLATSESNIVISDTGNSRLLLLKA